MNDRKSQLLIRLGKDLPTLCELLGDAVVGDFLERADN